MFAMNLKLMNSEMSNTTISKISEGIIAKKSFTALCNVIAGQNPADIHLFLCPVNFCQQWVLSDNPVNSQICN